MLKEETKYTEHGVAIRDDEDLVYSGRTRKRPPGASSMVQQIYIILKAHPEGRTMAELQAELSLTWRDNDAYRAYEQQLKKRRDGNVVRRSTPSPKFTHITEYGTVVFIAAAQRWWVMTRLHSMQRSNTARREGSGKNAVWYAGERAPLAIAECSVEVHLKEMDVGRAARQLKEQVQREQVKGILFDAIQAKGKRGHITQANEMAHAAVQTAYDYFTGRM